MIDPPEGFDARTSFPSQPSSPGTPKKQASNSNSMTSFSYVPPKKEVASKQPSEPKFLLQEEGTTMNFSSTRVSSSK